mmetsp:Transcript_19465/g.17248  ORF Transcript_19465/g.17248 Transcript_19465/m.17248 type:complete len:134 (+) Transcript_19465:465-866(+)
MRKQRQDTDTLLNRISPTLNKGRTLYNSSTEYSGFERDYDDINSINQNESLTKTRMKPINNFPRTSLNQSPVHAPKFNAYSGNMKLSMNRQSTKIKNINKSRFKKTKPFEPLKLVKRFDTDESYVSKTNGQKL